jgi:hypothetical protein
MNFGRYEVFDFELTRFEDGIVRTLEHRPSVSQTKSLFASIKLEPPAPELAKEIERFDFGQWSGALAGHYLTQQAGEDEQQALAQARGAQASTVKPTVRPGMRIEALAPPDLSLQSGATPQSRAKSVANALAERGADVTQTEIDEFARLANKAEIADSGHLGELGLCIRAVESWTRVRVDQ